MKKVSIIVAFYKSEKFIKTCVDSIIDQDYINLEIILVDDGSPDKCGMICDKYASRDDRIRVIHKLNEGACKARNDGLKISTGDYILVMDGDDWLEKDYVSYLVNLLESTASDMALSDKIFTTRDRVQSLDKTTEIWSSEHAVCQLLYPHVPVGPWSKIYTRSLIFDNNIDFSVPWSGEGLYFSTMAAYNANHVAVGHKKIYNYRMNNENSGLTKHNINMGINALWNINNLGKKINTTRNINKAIKWHTWKNNYFLLTLIIATNSINANRELYNSCISNLKKTWLRVAVESKISVYNKLSIIYHSLFPVLSAKRVIYNQKKDLRKDKYKL